MRTLDRFLVCAYIALAVLPFAAMRLRWHDHAMFGSVAPVPHPKISLAGFWGETYQQAYTAWFESAVGFKGYSVTTDNSILVHLFGETKAGAPVVVGEQGMLFLGEDFSYLNKDGYWLPEAPRVNAVADKIAALQTHLRTQHRAFVPVIVPAKTSFYRDLVPAANRRALGDPPPSDTRIYRALLAALDARHVLYIDARELLRTSPEPREHLWGPYARHWSHYASCLVMREVAHAYEQLTASSLPYDCTLAYEPPGRVEADFDLVQLLNTWRAPALPATVPMATHFAPTVGAHPSLLFAGTSFCWNLRLDAERSKAFSTIDLDYYDQTIYAAPGEPGIKPGTTAWHDALVSPDLYVLDLFESYLLTPGDTYADTFMRTLGADLGLPADVPNPSPGPK